MDKIKKFFFVQDKIFFFILISLFFHLIAAYFSVGYYQQDEHFSVLEPLNYKLGNNATLGWDFFYLYDRSWFLTFIFYIITKLFSLLSIFSPFKLAFAFRLFSSILGWISIICLIHLSKKIYKNEYTLYAVVLVSTLFWFYPYLHARTSSENFGCSFLIIGMTCFLFFNKKEISSFYFLIPGIIFGLSFLTRYTNIIPLISFGIWVLIINKNNFLELFYAFSGFIIIFIFGIAIDYWGYSQFQLSSLNYFLINYEHNQMKYFTSLPWWAYFNFILNEFLPPISIFILLSIPAFWIKFPKNFLSWTTFPLFIFLMTVSHKETRFLFPILVFTPIFIGSLIEIFLNYKKVFENFIIKYFFKTIFTIVIIVNFSGLFILSIIPANNSIGLFKYLYKNELQIEKIYTFNKIPYRKSDLLINYYRNAEIKLVKIFNYENCPINLTEIDKETNYEEEQIYSYPKWIFHYNIICNKENFLKDYIFTLDKNYYLFSDTAYLNFFYNKQKNKCELLYNTLPMWTLKINYNNWLKRTTKWYLFRCNFNKNES